MSVAHMAWAWTCSPTRPTARSILAVLANFANDEDLAWPAVSTLMGLTGLSERAIRSALAEMVETHVLDAVTESYPRKKAHAGSATVIYRLRTDRCRHLGIPPDARWAEKCPHTRVQEVHPSPDGKGAAGAPLRGARVQLLPVKGAGAAPEPLGNHPYSPSVDQLASPARSSAPARGDVSDAGLHRPCGIVHDPELTLCPVGTPAPASVRELCRQSRTVSERRRPTRGRPAPAVDATCWGCGSPDAAGDDGLCQPCTAIAAAVPAEPVHAEVGHGA